MSKVHELSTCNHTWEQEGEPKSNALLSIDSRNREESADIHKAIENKTDSVDRHLWINDDSLLIAATKAKGQCPFP